MGKTIRIFGWGSAAALLAAPAVAMQFTREVNWTASDFVFAAVMLATVGGALELLMRASGGWAYRGGAAIMAIGLFLLVWMNLAVGIIGSENNPANGLYLGVLGIGVAGAAAARLRAGGMAATTLAMAAAQVAIGGWALATGAGVDGAAWPRDVIVLTSGFTGFWLAAAWLFSRAVGQGDSADRSAPARGRWQRS
ncbi:hypothetical protein GGQ80_000305 [Sphingomonas jinjuensis]|uniref:Uncharacterized protein n=1 Tax=Sphingomonas jinjuensis TaxID=535907 RepID=A0A840F3P1_9SPHN|nr:hypothetical protein [Sphingomonas jinjuensis]MBB4152429.1 hypothetical protein [Sphingomonas jinjuensis]